MKVIGISGSPRKDGNTEILASHVLSAVAAEGLETELVSLAGLDIRGCTACMVCNKEERCSIEDDLFPIYEKMKTADGIILASPVYYGSATALIKGVLERTGYISAFHGNPFRGKVGGAFAVGRRAGHNFTVAELNFWFQALGMTLAGSSYWNVAFADGKGEVNKDEVGLKTAASYGKNLARLLKKLNS